MSDNKNLDQLHKMTLWSRRKSLNPTGGKYWSVEQQSNKDCILWEGLIIENTE